MLFRAASFAAWLSLLSSAAATPTPEEVTVATAAAGISYDTTYWYSFRNDYAVGKVLTVKNGLFQLDMETPGVSLQAGQYFKFVELSSSPPKYAIRTFFKGDAFSLDVYNNNGVSSTEVRLAATGFYSGQYWSIVPWGDNSFQLVNDFTGPGAHLDTYSDTLQAFLGTDNHSGQHWHFDKIQKIAC